MKKGYVWGIVAIIIIIVFFVLKATSTTGSTIKIGAILPLSGNEANVGESMKNGFQLAIDDINNYGQIHEKQIEVVFEDSRSDPKTAVTAYQKLTNVDSIKEIFTAVSGVTLAIAPIAEKNKVIILSTATAAPSISNAGDYIFRHNVLPQDEAEILAKYIYNSGVREVPILAVNTESGVSYRDEFKKDFEALGGKISIIEMFEKGSTDFKVNLAKLQTVKPQAVFLLGYATEMGIILKQAANLNMKVQWYTAYPAEDQQIITSGGEAVNGLIYSHYFDVSSTDSNFVDYTKRYFDKYNVQANAYSALAYDFMRVLSLAVNKCDSPDDTECVKNQLYKIQDYNGVTGKISFDQNGDTRKDIIMKTIKNGQFVRLEQ